MLKMMLCSCGAPGTIAGPGLVLCRLCEAAWDERCRRENCPGCYVCRGEHSLSGSPARGPAA